MGKAKQNKIWRKQARKTWDGYSADMRKRLGMFQDALRKRPKYCPQWLWALASGIFIDTSVLERIMFLDKPQGEQPVQK